MGRSKVTQPSQCYSECVLHGLRSHASIVLMIAKEREEARYATVIITSAFDINGEPMTPTKTTHCNTTMPQMIRSLYFLTAAPQVSPAARGTLDKWPPRHP